MLEGSGGNSVALTVSADTHSLTLRALKGSWGQDSRGAARKTSFLGQGFHLSANAFQENDGYEYRLWIQAAWVPFPLCSTLPLINGVTLARVHNLVPSDLLSTIV